MNRSPRLISVPQGWTDAGVALTQAAVGFCKRPPVGECVLTSTLARVHETRLELAMSKHERHHVKAGVLISEPYRDAVTALARAMCLHAANDEGCRAMFAPLLSSFRAAVVEAELVAGMREVSGYAELSSLEHLPVVAPRRMRAAA